MNHQSEATISALELEMPEVLRSCEGAMELGVTASLLLATELAVLNKPMEAITLGELRAALERVAEHYSVEKGSVLRRVKKGLISIDGIVFTSPELVGLEGEEVLVDLPEGCQSHTLLAWSASSEPGGNKSVFQIHHIGH